MAILTTDREAERCASAAEQFVLEGWIATAPFEDLLDLSIDSAEQGRAVLHMPFKVKHCQGGGLLHGGALTTLADTAVAMAIKSLLPPGTRFATVSLQMEFLAPVAEGTVTATANVSRTGERTFAGEALVCDRHEQPVARFVSTFKVARNQSG
jgi:acyl-CoA thioesterase